MSQEKDLEFRRAEQQADLVRERASRKREAQVSEILSNEEIEKANILSEHQLKQDRIEQEQQTQAREIAKRREIELAEHARAIAVAKSSEEEVKARAQADEVRATAISSEEAVFTAREKAQAERRKQVELILTALEAEKDQLRQSIRALTEKDVAARRAEVSHIEAEAFSNAQRIKSEAWRVRNQAEAEGIKLKAEANNVASPEARVSALRLRLVEKLEDIIRASVKPMEKIEGIKIIHFDGLGSPAGGELAAGGGAGLPDQLVASALRYRAQAPLLDHLLGEIGIDPGDPSKLSQLLGDLKKGAPAKDKEK